MINPISIKNQKFNEVNLAQILFYTLPVSFIVGNLVLSTHLLVFLLFSFWLVRKKKLKVRFGNLSLILLIFFLYLFISTTLQFPGIWNTFVENQNINVEKIPLENNPIFKSFLLFRFLMLIIIVDILFLNKILKLKQIFFTSLICTSFVSFDVILQFVVGQDLFGFEKIGRWNSGPFGDELIAGGYLQRFSFLSFFYIFIFLKKEKFYNHILFFTMTFHIIAIFLAGNRMPALLFLFGCFLIMVFLRNLRFLMSLSLSLSLVILLTIASFDENIRSGYLGFYKNFVNFDYYLTKTKTKILEDGTKIKVEERVYRLDNPNDETIKKKLNISSSGHVGIFRTSIALWNKQPVFGHGLKSFRFKCWEILSKMKSERYSCSNQSHNYYIELLTEAGIFGAIFIFIFLISIFRESLNYIKKIYKKNKLDLNLFIAIFLIFFIEIWPLKSTGSFFTSWNATFLWLIISMLYAIIRKNKLKL